MHMAFDGECRRSSDPSILLPTALQVTFQDAWKLCNAEDGSRFLENEEESVLQYCVHMSKSSDLHPLTRVA